VQCDGAEDTPAGFEQIHHDSIRHVACKSTRAGSAKDRRVDEGDRLRWNEINPM